MPDSLPSIDLDLPQKLEDREYRQAFFLAESSALIAKQLIALRKRRGLNQTQVAEALETGQPAISRVERADYRNWSFNTLRRLADAMDARLRVIIQPAEDVISEYEAEEAQAAKSEIENIVAEYVPVRRDAREQSTQRQYLAGSYPMGRRVRAVPTNVGYSIEPISEVAALAQALPPSIFQDPFEFTQMHRRKKNEMKIANHPDGATWS
jgi:transcriptional regulator with XRE-family HTH domain